MKVKLSLLLVTLLVVSPAAFAADKPAPADKKDAACCEKCKDACKCEADKCKCDDKEKKVVLTGSHIPQRVGKLSRHPNTMSPLTIITAADLAGTGETDVAAALRRLVPAMH